LFSYVSINSSRVLGSINPLLNSNVSIAFTLNSGSEANVNVHDHVHDHDENGYVL